MRISSTYFYFTSIDKSILCSYNEDVLKFFDGVNDLSLRIMSVGEDEFKRILKENKVDESNFNYKGLLIDKNIFYQEGSKNYKEVNLFDLNKFKTVTGSINNKDLSIRIIKRIEDNKDI